MTCRAATEHWWCAQTLRTNNSNNGESARNHQGRGGKQRTHHRILVPARQNKIPCTPQRPVARGAGFSVVGRERVCDRHTRDVGERCEYEKGRLGVPAGPELVCQHEQRVQAGPALGDALHKVHHAHQLGTVSGWHCAARLNDGPPRVVGPPCGQQRASKPVHGMCCVLKSTDGLRPQRPESPPVPRPCLRVAPCRGGTSFRSLGVYVGPVRQTGGSCDSVAAGRSKPGQDGTRSRVI